MGPMRLISILMHDLYSCLDIPFRCVLQDAMTHVEDVAGATFGPTQDIMDTFFHFGDGSKQGNRVEITLYGSVVADSTPALIERDTPIQADHVAASLTHKRDQR